MVSWMRRRSVHEERSLQQQAMHRLAQLSSTLQRLFGVQCTVASGIGPLDMQTMARVLATRPDLIVVGEDADWFSDADGTHAAAMTARISGRPVLVVRNAPRGQYASVGITVDFSHASARTLRTAMRLLPKAQFTFLQVSGADIEPAADPAGGQGSANGAFPVFAAPIDAGSRAIPAPASSQAASAEPDLVVLNDRQESLLTRLLQRKPNDRAGRIGLSDILVVPTAGAGMSA